MQTVQFDAISGDGSVINVTFFNSEADCEKGIAIIVHGFGEHAGSYDELAQRLSQAGYASAIFNQRGHGLRFAPDLKVDSGELKVEDAGGREIPPRPLRGHPSKGRNTDMRGIIPGYQCFLDDIRAVTAAVKLQAPGVPIILYGHSMGGNIVTNYLLKNDQSDYACAVLESPWLGLFKEPNPLVKGLAKVLGWFTPNIAIFNKLSPEDITNDAVRADMFRSDPLYHNRISMRMFTGINKGCKYALANASKLTIPIYLAAAGSDRIVSMKAIVEFAWAVSLVATFKIYNSFHAIHNDVHREDYYRDVISYLDAHIAIAPRNLDEK